MKKRIGLLVAALAVIASLAACGGGGGGTDTPPPPDNVYTAPAVTPITAFRQTVVSSGTDSYYDAYPGQANVWTLDQDFSLVDGFALQFNWALSLMTGTGTWFPTDQVYSELTFTGPYLGTADGVLTAAVSNGQSIGMVSLVTGSYAAFLNATSDSYLQQTVDLSAVPSGTPVYFKWTDAVSLDPGIIPGYQPHYYVVLRQTDGTELKTLYSNPTSTKEKSNSVRLDNYVGQKVVLSFEFASTTGPWTEPSCAVIDNVSVTDGSTEYVTNGDFETGDLTGWTANTPLESQNMTSGVRYMDGLKVTRSFYTVPNKLWGRWVDVFENTTSATISKTVTYDTCLGSDDGCDPQLSSGLNIIYYTPGTNDKAVTSWSEIGSRDVGLVYGNNDSVWFRSDDGTGNGVGSGVIDVQYNISLAPGQKTSIVNFVLMDGKNTGAIATSYDPNAPTQATDIDAAALDIVANFWTDPQYLAGMTQEQIAVIRNFSK